MSELETYRKALEQIAGRPMSALQAHNIARRALGMPERVVEPDSAYETQRDVGADETKEKETK